MKQMNGKWLKRAVTLIGILALGWVLLAFLVYPVFHMLYSVFFNESSFTMQTLEKFIKYEKIRSSLIHTFAIAGCTVILTLVVGLFQALATDYFDLRGFKWLRYAYYMPFFYGSVSLVMGYRYLYSSSGVVTKALAGWFPGLDPKWFTGPLAILMIHTFSMSAYNYLFVHNAIRRIDNATYEACKSLGGSNFRYFIKILLPLVKPAVFGSTILVLIGSLGSYAAPSLVGGGFEMISTTIYVLLSTRNISLAALLSIFLGILSLVLLLWFRSIEKKNNYVSVSKVYVPLSKKKIKNPLVSLVVHVLAWGLFTVYVMPIAIVVLLSFAPAENILKETIPTVYSLENYVRFFTQSNVFKPFLNSMIICGLAALAGLIVGTVSSLLIHRGKSRSKVLLEIAVFLPWVLPASTMAIGLITAYSDQNMLLFGSSLVGTYWILPIAYFNLCLPLIIRIVSASLYSLDRSLEDAARSLGATRWTTMRRILLPTILPSLLAALALSFSSNLDEYTVSALLYNIHNKPIGIALAEANNYLEFGKSLVYIVVLIVISFATFFISRKYSKDNVSM